MTPAERATVVARIGETTLTLCDFAQRLDQTNQYLRARYAQPEQRRALLQSWVDAELLAAEARARGLDREAVVRQAVDSTLARQLETEIRASIHAPEVTDEDVRTFYDAHRNEYDTPAQVRAAQIVVGSRARADQVAAEARAHANDDAYWRSLVQRESLDTSARATAGDLGFFPIEGGGEIPADVARAAFALAAPGDVAPVVASTHGGPGHSPAFHVVRLLARRDALHRTLDEVRRQIQTRLFRERNEAAQNQAVDQLIQSLRRRANVTMDDAALAAIRIETPAAAPVQAAPGRTP